MTIFAESPTLIKNWKGLRKPEEIAKKGKIPQKCAITIKRSENKI
jgi:hypothetical protein